VRSIVLALVLGASALGVTAAPTQASAAGPRAVRTAHYRVNHYRARHVGHYPWHARGPYRYYRPAVPLIYGPWYRPYYTGYVPVPCP
jgi:hypothetical protein